MFGKPGRPPEDAFLRRREIYLAVAPLIEKSGPKGVTMRQAAVAANMSLGGIYHYFPSKRELVLFGVSPDALRRSCEDFHRRYAHLARTDPQGLLAKGLDAAAAMVAFARPAVVASLTLGAATTLDAIEAAMEVTLDDFAGVLRAIPGDMTEAELDALQRAIRRVLLAAMLDRNASPSEVHEELLAIVEGTGSPVVQEQIGAEALVS